MISDQIEDFLDRFSAAWEVGHARAFAALFIEDATFVGCEGRWLRGREAIEREHEDLFRGGNSAGMRLRALNVRALGPAVRLVVTEGGCGQRQTFTLILQNGRWVCAAFQNSPVGGAVFSEAS